MMIKDVITPLNGFFSHLNFNFPTFITKEQLDIGFFTNYSQRNIAPIVKYYLIDEQLNNDALDSIGVLLVQMFGKKWTKQAAVYDIEYNPISNYHDNYHETNSLVHEGKNEEQWGDERNSTRTDDLTETQNKGTVLTSLRTDDLTEVNRRNLTDTLQETVQNNIYGFNSSDSSGDSNGTDNYTKTGTGDTTIENTGTQENKTTASGADITTNTGTQSNSSTGSGNKTHNNEYSDNVTRDYSHSGNIGNHTTQHLITQEIELWSWNYMQDILKDVVNFLTIPTYIG